MKKYIMGIDQGTTGTKVMIFDKKSNILSSAYHELTQIYPRPGWVEHNPLEILENTLRTIKKSLSIANLTSNDIAAIGITNQRDTTVFWNKNTGIPFINAIVWQDRRNLDIIEKVSKDFGIDVANKTGMPLIPNASIGKIKWCLEHYPDLVKGIANGDYLYGTIDSWLIWNLSGKKAHVTDYSNASVTAMLNAKNLCYDETILHLFSIPPSILPHLKSSSEVYAYTDENIFNAKIPIASSIGDQQAALLGQCCIHKNMAKNTYGTGSFLLINTGDEYIPPQNGLISPIAWEINQNTCYALEGIADVSGAVIQWLRDEMGVLQSSKEAAHIASSVQNTNNVYFVPAFVGLGSPYFDAYARGTILGLDDSTSPAHIIRAALESMAYQVNDYLKIMQKVTNQNIHLLRVDGGGANNDFLLQFQADILGIPVERPKIIETTCLGAAYLAGLAIGYWDSLEHLSTQWQLDRCFEPKISLDYRQTLCGQWEKAIRLSSQWLK